MKHRRDGYIRGSRRLEYISILNVISAFGVVMLHCNGCFWEGPAQGKSWISANFIETLFYWPVPIFFMICGATLMGYRDRMGTSDYLKRRARRTLVPFLIWSLIGFAYCTFFSFVDGKQPDLSLTTIIDGIVNTKYVGIYWFFPPLFAVYLAIPIFSAISDKKRVFSYAAIVGVVLVSILPLLFQLLHLKWNSSITPPPVTGYMLYAILGWLLSKVEIKPRWRVAIYVLAVAGWLTHMFGTLALSSPEIGISKVFKGYLNIPAVAQALGVFVFVRYACERNNAATQRIAALCTAIAPQTFGVYLIHWYVLNLIRRSGMVPIHSIVYRTVGALLVFCLCILVTWLYRSAVAGIRFMSAQRKSEAA
ncbi:acyltransferase [Olsenella intestinalis]|uniref:acyltransferase n=1 Tax=Olsenella intestinalis TaxID=2930083 RepID=UPI00200D6827|nr:acyltransferase [Olsenella intestinalis]